MKEIWKEVDGFNGRYVVSNLGRVKSFVKNKKQGEILKPGQAKKYPMLILYKKEALTKRQPRLVHRLVAKAFIPNDQNKPHINHIDGSRDNNCTSNLEWCTHKENMRHARACGAFSSPKDWKHEKGEERYNAKMTKAKVKLMREMYAWSVEQSANTYSKVFPMAWLAKCFGMSKTTTQCIIRGVTWKHIN